LNEKNQKIHDHYRECDKSLVQSLQNQLTNENPAQINLIDQLQPQTDVNPRERFLLNELQNRMSSNKKQESSFKSEIETLKHELFKLKQKPVSKLLNEKKEGNVAESAVASAEEKKSDAETFDPMEVEFDQEQKIERIEAEMNKLKKANDFLRERAMVFDKMNTQINPDVAQQPQLFLNYQEEESEDGN